LKIKSVEKLYHGGADMTPTKEHEYVFPFGKHRGKHINEVDRGYVGWWFGNAVHPTASLYMSYGDWFAILNAIEYYAIGKGRGQSPIRNEIQDGFFPEPS
jgi:uncharacterized protein (DUF3820 family)